MSGLSTSVRAQSGQVLKIVRLVATSEDSWEDAARNGVAEATKTIDDLTGATLIKADLVARDGLPLTYRVKLEMAFQLDRSRLAPDTAETVRVRRYLVLANRTLPSPGLASVLEEKASTGRSEFHILVPEHPARAIVADPADAGIGGVVEVSEQARLEALAEAEERLDAFRSRFSPLGARLTAEVGLGDPLHAAQRVMDRASFDEIIVSTLPIGVSRWIKLDLPSRLERAFGLPVTHLVPDG